eukprot:Colp12_sorted_trinity150504_noHs@29840
MPRVSPSNAASLPVFREPRFLHAPISTVAFKTKPAPTPRNSVIPSAASSFLGEQICPSAPANVGSKFLQNILAKQENHQPNPNYLKKVQRDEFKESLRRDVLEWLYKLNKHFDYQSETFATAVNYFDRFLSQLRVKPTHVQLIAIASLLLSAKNLEVWNTQPSLQELSVAANGVYSCNDIERMEKIVLTKLNWNLNPVTPHLILHQVLEHVPLAAPLKEKLIASTEHFLDASISEYYFLKYRPSALCCAALGEALVREGAADPELLAHVCALTGTTKEEANECSHDIKRLLAQLEVSPF